MARHVVKGVRKRKWNCLYCDTKDIPGDIRECPNCGKSRDGDITFARDPNAKLIAGEEAKKISRNPDWICAYCDSLNSDNVNECCSCGSSRENSEKNYLEHKAEIEARRNQKSKDDDTKMYTSSSDMDLDDIKSCNNNDYESSKHSNQQSYNRANHVIKSNNKCAGNHASRVGNFVSNGGNAIASFNWGSAIKVIAIVMAIVMTVTGLFHLFTPKLHDVTIQDFFWERSIHIEKLVTVQEEGWFLPSDARALDKEWKFKDTETFISHYEEEEYESWEVVETKTEEYESYEIVGHKEVLQYTYYRDLGNGYEEEVEVWDDEPIYDYVTREREVDVYDYVTRTRDVPVYDTRDIYDWWYTYERDVWKTDFYSKSSGNDQDPYWQEVQLNDKQRESGRTQIYKITVLDENGETKEYTFDYNTWKSLGKDDNVQIKVDIFGNAELVINDQAIAEDKAR